MRVRKSGRVATVRGCLAGSELKLHYPAMAGILIADLELASEPVHVTVLALKSDQTGKSFFKEALKIPAFYKRIEWWDFTEGPMPNPDVTYPRLRRPAAFLCADKACSLPFFSLEKLKKAILK